MIDYADMLPEERVAIIQNIGIFHTTTGLSGFQIYCLFNEKIFMESYSDGLAWYRQDVNTGIYKRINFEEVLNLAPQDVVEKMIYYLDFLTRKHYR